MVPGRVIMGDVGREMLNPGNELAHQGVVGPEDRLDASAPGRRRSDASWN
jgi:hypothetical protein